MHHDPSALGSLILIQITPNKRTLRKENQKRFLPFSVCRQIGRHTPWPNKAEENDLSTYSWIMEGYLTWPRPQENGAFISAVRSH